MTVRNYAGLVAYLEAAERNRFAYSGAGTHDCIRHGKRAILAQDLPLPAGLPSWRSRRAAEALLAERGGLIAAVDGVLDRIAPAMAQRGDIAAVEMPDGPALGVVESETIALVSAGTGLLRVPRRAAIAAWSAICLKP